MKINVLMKQLQRIETDLLDSQDSEAPVERWVNGKTVAESALRKLSAMGDMYQERQALREIALTLNWYLLEIERHWINVDVETYREIFDVRRWIESWNPTLNICVYSPKQVAKRMTALISERLELTI